MVRYLVFGNGNILVCIDKNDRVRDFYHPFVGQENHVAGHRHKTGIWTEGKFSWVFENPGWEGFLTYKKETLVGETIAKNSSLAVELDITEAVHHEKNIFLRKITVKNLSDKKKEIRLFLNQHFYISESNVGDTVYYHPGQKALISYKGKDYFLISGIAGRAEEKTFDDYATGEADIHGKEGTYVDAVDGILSKNPIEHGSVDSTIGFYLDVPANNEKEVYYWIVVGKDYQEVKELNEYILRKKPEFLLREVTNYWKKWVNKKKISFDGLDSCIEDLFKRSLLIIRAQTDNRGAIIAANDSDTLFLKKDSYSYMWPRDGALIARSLDRVGHEEITERFFEFCKKVTTSRGFLMHKYRADGSVGSTWHPWIKGKKLQIPIQEDETALVLDALWKHYEKYSDKQFVKNLYESFIKKAGDFLANYRDRKTKLAEESYDIWEEKLGIYTFTCSTVFAGLNAAANFANLFKDSDSLKKYEKSAKEIREAILKYLYDKDKKMFIKGLHYDVEGKLQKDFTVDVSSGYGIFEYKVLDVHDLRVYNTMKIIEDKLTVKNGIGGLTRYEYDNYHRIDKKGIGNPWFISTLWLAEYYIARALTLQELEKAREILNWVCKYKLSTGVLSEQLNPFTGEPLSVSPLTWSHAGFVIAVVKYLDKLEELKKR